MWCVEFLSDILYGDKKTKYNDRATCSLLCLERMGIVGS